MHLILKNFIFHLKCQFSYFSLENSLFVKRQFFFAKEFEFEKEVFVDVVDGPRVCLFVYFVSNVFKLKKKIQNN